MRILLTGRNGQVGRALTKALASLSEVVATDRTSVDLSKLEQLSSAVRAARPDVIVNAGAYTDVEGAESNERLAFVVNAESVGELATLARELGIPLIHYSTDYVFDGSKTSAYVESDRTAPLSVYGRSKLEGENRIRESGCAHLILRTSWVYSTTGRNFLTSMLRLSAERDELRIVDDQIGAPTSARFIAAATAQMIRQAGSSESLQERIRAGETVHLVNGGATNWLGFASAIFDSRLVQERYRVPRLIGIKTSDYPTRASRPKNSVLSTERARTVWKLSVPDWHESLEECLTQLEQDQALPKSSEKRTMSSSPR